jgi:hypothetical protein
LPSLPYACDALEHDIDARTEDISYKTIKLIPINMLLLKSVLKIQEKDIVKYYLALIKFQQIKSANIIMLLILSAVYESIAWNIQL